MYLAMELRKCRKPAECTILVLSQRRASKHGQDEQESSEPRPGIVLNFDPSRRACSEILLSAANDRIMQKILEHVSQSWVAFLQESKSYA